MEITRVNFVPIFPQKAVLLVFFELALYPFGAIYVNVLLQNGGA
jgi:hypothetical protein